MDKTINSFVEAIQASRDQPHALADLQLDMSIKYAVVADIYKGLRLSKNQFWQEKKVLHLVNGKMKSRSDKDIEIEWNCTPHGNKEMRATIELRTLEKLMGSIKTFLRVLENESHNNY